MPLRKFDGRFEDMGGKFKKCLLTCLIGDQDIIKSCKQKIFNYRDYKKIKKISCIFYGVLKLQASFTD